MQKQSVEIMNGLMVYNMQSSDKNKQRLYNNLLEC
jgi:hypothetical protein